MTDQTFARRIPLLTGLEYHSLPKRKITEETCSKWGYGIGSHAGKPCQVANYRNEDGTVVAQKIRYPNKDFLWAGDPHHAGLYGQHLWRDGGKKVVITEGEIDALTVSQLQENKWPVVSIPNGAANAPKDIGKQIEWLEKFEEVIFMFDSDAPGVENALKCAALLTPGKAKIATLPLKDPNEMLQAGRGGDVIKAMWDAKVWRPDEIIAGDSLWERIIEKNPHAEIAYPWDGLTAKLRGLRQKEIVTLCAGSGIGKSTACRELTHWLLSQGQTIGVIALEESVKRTALGVLSIEMNQTLHLKKQEEIDEKKLRKAYEKTVGSGRFYTYDHFGSLEADNLFSRIRYLATGCGCGWIVLDHLSIVVSGMGDGDERRLIDNLMTKLRSLVEQLGIGLILVSHLKDTDGKSLEEGGQTHLNLLRGSRSIGQLSDIVLGLERNQQDPKNKNLTSVRILKDRWTGETGIACSLLYDQSTGRLKETTLPSPFEDESAETPPAEEAGTKKDF